MELTARDLDTALFQIVTAHGIIEDSKLRQHIIQLEQDFGSLASNVDINESFKRVNARMRFFSIEIRTVVDSITAGERDIYHGVANVEGDLVSRDFGSDYDAQELKFFEEILTKLLTQSVISTVEAVDAYPKAESIAKVEGIIGRLLRDRWLDRDSRDYIQIGLRSYLELSSFLQEKLRNLESEQEPDEVASFAKIRFPQVILY